MAGESNMRIGQNKRNRVLSTRTSWKALVGLFVLAVSAGSTHGQQKIEVQNGVPQEQAKLNSDAGISSRPPVDIKPGDDFLIGNEDVLTISVWKEPEISRSVPVRSDGRISLPLIGEVQAAGKTPKQLQTELTSSLAPYISAPAVTVIVTEIKSQRFNILGKVQRPGAYPLTPPMTIVDAIALAGGLRDFAKVKNIYVLRLQADGSQTRLPFNYKQVTQGIHSEQNVALQSRDTFVVP
jgi:polysaccharide biosynthesis/export protein